MMRAPETFGSLGIRQIEGGQHGAPAYGHRGFFQVERGGFLEVLQGFLKGAALGGGARLRVVGYEPAFGFARINNGGQRRRRFH